MQEGLAWSRMPLQTSGRKKEGKEGGRLMTRLGLEGCPCFEVVPLAPVKPPRPGSPPHSGVGG